MDIAARSRLLMIGDSITDAGRSRPVAEGLWRDALGHGYVSMVAAILTADFPECPVRVRNAGCAGHTVRDLAARWQDDVIDYAPDWLSIMIGINDVWRQFDRPLQDEEHVLPNEYRRFLDQLVRSTRDQVDRLQGIVLMTPFYLEPNAEDAMRARMDEYGAIVRDVANEHGTRFVDTQAAFDRLLVHYHSSHLAWDRVHPTAAGHMVLAHAFLAAVGAR